MYKEIEFTDEGDESYSVFIFARVVGSSVLNESCRHRMDYSTTQLELSVRIPLFNLIREIQKSIKNVSDL